MWENGLLIDLNGEVFESNKYVVLEAFYNWESFIHIFAWDMFVFSKDVMCQFIVNKIILIGH